MSVIRNPEEFWEKVAIRTVVAGIFGIALLNFQSEIEKHDQAPLIYDSGKPDVFSNEAVDAGYAPSVGDQNTKYLGRMAMELNLTAAEQDTDQASCINHLTNALEASRIADVPISRIVHC